ncbi:MAG: helix-turn-helix domain-containing protein [Planctomycetaceae bacterium]|nr:helix-turn-helix domain-containing protein [Planctomycetaceae bacterium]
MKFVVAAQDGPLSMTELCRKFGISRKTGYKLLARYERDGPEGMRECRELTKRGRGGPNCARQDTARRPRARCGARA